MAQWIFANHPSYSAPFFLTMDKNWDKLDEWVFDRIKPDHVPFKSEPVLS
jgi:hypothetical protein